MTARAEHGERLVSFALSLARQEACTHSLTSACPGSRVELPADRGLVERETPRRGPAEQAAAVVKLYW